MTQDQREMLLEDVRDIMVESSAASRWATIEGKHLLGERICRDLGNEPDEIGLIAELAVTLNKPERGLWDAIKFFRMWPNLNMAPISKDMAWYQVCEKFLRGSDES